jgi:hypothetical protein
LSFVDNFKIIDIDDIIYFEKYNNFHILYRPNGDIEGGWVIELLNERSDGHIFQS